MQTSEQYLTPEEKAAEWNVSQQSVTGYCRAGKIEGAYQEGGKWLIPASASKPPDGRKIRQTRKPHSGGPGLAATSPEPPAWREAPNLFDFETAVVTGEALADMARAVSTWERRDCFTLLWDYLNSPPSDKVCVIYGLRRTGKTTLVKQALLAMSGEQLARSAYVKALSSDSMASLNRDLKRLRALGCTYVFIDEVTLIADFIDSSSLLSDVFAAQGMKIVLSGTDSLGFWLAQHDELYDRAVMVHTTYIPFHEHRRVLDTADVDSYIRFGGTMKAGNSTFAGSSQAAEEASFRDDESTREYIDTAICRNILHSLANFRDGTRFRHLEELYDAGELTSAINRVIEDVNHRFLAKVMTGKFKSHDLGLSARNLRSERDGEKRSDLLDSIDVESVTGRLMEYLEIRDRDELEVGITPVHAAEIEEYLKALDLIVDCDVETTVPGAPPLKESVLAQPGMRYCQARALVQALLGDPRFSQAPEAERARVKNRILEEVRGRMLEEIVLLDTMCATRGERRVFKLRLAAGEFDMVIYDPNSNTCECFEVKHSSQIVPEQCKHLNDPEARAATERRFGAIVRRCVLYNGPDSMLGEVQYRNVVDYLCALRSNGTAWKV